ncbi:hypothetical protein [Clostridium lundense]|uniref:hypothetical protein n=1 Tax=Clostridium lundense TaxID=319475 RepID=UPI0004877E7F|nr:hypothetical protein [Clostridium lundense]
MYKEVWNKYMKGFKFLLPFILVHVLFQSTSLNLNLNQYTFLGGSFTTFEQTIASNFVPILFILFVGSLFYSFLTVVIKKLINGENINYIESFKESLNIYLKYLGLNIILSTITLGVILLGFLSILMSIAFILMIYLSIVFTPCEAYLVYNNTRPVTSLKQGIAVGKKHSGEIILLSFMLCVILSIIAAVTLNFKTNVISEVFLNFITTCASFYVYTFAMTICKKEERVEALTLEY